MRGRPTATVPSCSWSAEVWSISPVTNNIPDQDLVEVSNGFFVKKITHVRSSMGHAPTAQDYPLPTGSSGLDHFTPTTENVLLS